MGKHERSQQLNPLVEILKLKEYYLSSFIVLNTILKRHCRRDHLAPPKIADHLELREVGVPRYMIIGFVKFII
jgi:hypothetical protein